MVGGSISKKVGEEKVKPTKKPPTYKQKGQRALYIAGAILLLLGTIAFGLKVGMILTLIAAVIGLIVYAASMFINHDVYGD